jgi:sister chromatid cohesion protein PDS5
MSSKNKSKAGSKDTKIFDPSGAWLGKVSRKGEIISRLSELHEVLRDMPQLEMADRPAGFKKTVSQLISARILGNSDKDMRLLACCCLCDIFRISAPDIPFSDEECVKVFEVLVNQLRGLATFDRKVSGTGTKIMYILRSLATVNTCVLPVILAAQGVEGAEEVVTGMFHAFISGIHSEHEEEGTFVRS